MVNYKHNTIFESKSKIKISDFFITILLILLIAILVSNPTKYASATIKGFKLFAFSVFPTLFPFIFISKILTSLNTPLLFSYKLKKVANKIFRGPSSIIYVYLISIICGYPIGAKMTSDLYDSKTISSSQVRTFCYFCSTSGILFIIGTIGTIMFNSATIGIIIYISHILGCFIGGLLLSRTTKQDLSEKETTLPNNSNIISTSISSSIQSILVVGAYITLFCLFTQILCDLTICEYLINLIGNIFNIFNINTNLSSGVFTGIFEMTNGCSILSSFSSKAAIVFATGLISFGGISILLQSMTFLKNTQIKARTLVVTKSVHALCSMLIAALILFIV